jgi:hypothetical protein
VYGSFERESHSQVGFQVLWRSPVSTNLFLRRIRANDQGGGHAII